MLLATLGQLEAHEPGRLLDTPIALVEILLRQLVMLPATFQVGQVCVCKILVEAGRSAEALVRDLIGSQQVEHVLNRRVDVLSILVVYRVGLSFVSILFEEY